MPGNRVTGILVFFAHGNSDLTMPVEAFKRARSLITLCLLGFSQILSTSAQTLEVFDIDGLLLASTSRLDDGILSISGNGIYGFALSHTNSGGSGIDDIVGFDNIVFNSVTCSTFPGGGVTKRPALS